jgi:hypothetical protein
MPNEYVIKGNAAILKCSIPSFVADFVQVVSWVDDSGEEILTTEDFSSSKEKVDLNYDRESSTSPIISA